MVGLDHYAANVVSQNGEDGILAEIFRRIQPRSRMCVEFGAWDGKHLSNTWALWHEAGWSAVLIEGDRERFLQLQQSISSFPSVKAVHAYVTSTGLSRLDSLLAAEDLGPDGIDLLSIDIDGDDYHVWASLTTFHPRVVVVEYNPTIPPELDLVQRQGEYFGASASALTRLAREKGYGLAVSTATNCIYVRGDDFPALGVPEFDLIKMFDRSHLCHVINAYDGKTYLTNIPIYSPPLPLASFAYWWERMRDNLFNTKSLDKIPADRILPVSIVVESLVERRSLQARILAAAGTAITSTGRKLPPYRLAERVVAHFKRRLDERSLLRHWRQSGSPVPPPHLFKQRLLRRYARRYRLRTLVETGTYLGDMVFAMRKHFRRIFSIELSPELFQQAQTRFLQDPNISILQGDSSQILPSLLSDITEPTLFWLDGHYSAGITALGAIETPISAEIEAILRHPVRGHVILIDDARNFDGSHDYPPLAVLQESVLSKAPSADFAVSDDIIRIVL